MEFIERPLQLNSPREQEIEVEIFEDTFSEVDEVSGLTYQEMIFCNEYVNFKGNATEAGVKANYSQAEIRTLHIKLLRRPEIKAYIKELRSDIIGRLRIDGLDIAHELSRIAFSNIMDVYDNDMKIKPLSEFTDKERASIASIEVLDEYVGQGSFKELSGHTTKIRFHDKLKALEMLGKILGVGETNKLEQDANGGTILILPAKTKE